MAFINEEPSCSCKTHFPWTAGDVLASTMFDHCASGWILPGGLKAIPQTTKPVTFQNCPPGVIASIVLPLVVFLISFSCSVVQVEEPEPSRV